MSGSENSPVREGLFPAQRVRWGLPDALVGLAIGTALIGASMLLGKLRLIPRSDLVGVTVQVVFYLILAAFVVAVARRRGLGSLRRDFGFELRWVDLPIGVGLAIALQLANGWIYLFAINVLRLPAVSTSNVSLPKSEGLAVFDAIAIASFFAPIVEELLFRGLIMRAVRNLVIRRSRFESPHTTRRAARISVVVSALVFAAAHLYESTNLTMLFTLGVWIFLVGVVTAAIDTRTGRLGPSMITHMLTNGIAAVLVLSSR